MSHQEILRKRLLYQSHHRGTKEMDLVLGKFVQQNLNSMSYEQLKKFESLLALPDQEIQALLHRGNSILDILSNEV